MILHKNWWSYTDWRSSWKMVWNLRSFSRLFSNPNAHPKPHQLIMTYIRYMQKVSWKSNFKSNIQKYAGCTKYHVLFHVRLNLVLHNMYTQILFCHIGFVSWPDQLTIWAQIVSWSGNFWATHGFRRPWVDDLNLLNPGFRVRNLGQLTNVLTFEIQNFREL